MAADRDAGSGRSQVWNAAFEVIAGASILVVDDNPANVSLLDRLLRRAGAEHVVGITDARLVLDHFRGGDFDLILLDLHMPHLDGIAVLELLAGVIASDSYVPVLVLTADTTGDARERALAAGARDFVTKPFDHTEVLLRIKNLLETRSMHQALKRHNMALEVQIHEATEREAAAARAHGERTARIRAILEHRNLTVAFQPIVDLTTMVPIGVEALARFPAPPARPPDHWFAEADTVGLGADLELLAVQAAIAQTDHLARAAYLSVNLSPAVVSDPRLLPILEPVGTSTVLELTEHAVVDDYHHLTSALAPLRGAGVRIAVDDAGSGYASLQHILRLQPDIIKLDIALTRDIHHDPARRALAGALVTFAGEIGATITAEGIETAEELVVLQQLGVACGQGYYLGRPAPLARAEMA